MIHVVDGDTFDCVFNDDRDDGTPTSIRVRLCMIDTPEIHPRNGGGSGGENTTQHNAAVFVKKFVESLILNKQVRIIPWIDPTRNSSFCHFGRLLAECEFDDGLKLTKVLLDKQFARPYPTGSTTTATPWETAVLQFIIAKLEEPLDSSKPLLER